MPQSSQKDQQKSSQKSSLSGIEFPYLFLCLPIAAAYLMTAYPTPSNSAVQPIQIPAMFLILALVTCAVTLLLEAIYTRHGANTRPPTILCSLLLLSGTVLYMICTVVPYASVMPLTIISAILIGIGGALLLLLWTCAYAQLSGKQILPNVAASVLLGSVFVLITMAIAPVLDTTTKALTLLVISSIPLPGIVETTPEGYLAVLAKDTQEKSIIPTHILKREDGQRATLALGVLVLYWAVCACSWGDVAAQGSFIGSARNEIASSIGTIVSSIVLLLICRSNNTKSNLELEKQAEFSASLVAAILLFVSWAVSQAFTTQSFLVGVILGIGQGLALCTSISAVARTAFWTGPIHAMGSSGAIVCVLLLALAGWAFFHPTAGTSIAVVINTIYLVLALSWRIALHFRHERIRREHDQTQVL